MKRSRIRGIVSAFPDSGPPGLRPGYTGLTGNGPMRLQHAGGVANHQQDEQQYGQADAHGQGLDGPFRRALVPDEVKQPAEEAANDNEQKQDDNDFCKHEQTVLLNTVNNLLYQSS